MGGKPKIGLVGCGGVGHEHADRLSALGNPATAYLDADPARAGELAGKYGGRALPSLEALLNDCDTLVIATPPYLHPAQILEAARAGKNIFVEKPLCLSIPDADAIGTALSKSISLFMVGYVLRFFPGFRLMKETFSSGALGNLVSIYDRRVSDRTYWESPWLGDPAKSGGMTVEFFTHDLDWILWVAGMPRRVLGRTSKAYQGTDSSIEDNVWTWLDFSHGSGTGEASWTTSPPSSVQEIIGDRGYIVSREGRIKLVREGKADDLEATGEEPYLAQMREFLACIAEGRAPVPGFAEARRVLAVALAVQESARTGQPATPARE